MLDQNRLRDLADRILTADRLVLTRCGMPNDCPTCSEGSNWITRMSIKDRETLARIIRDAANAMPARE